MEDIEFIASARAALATQTSVPDSLANDVKALDQIAQRFDESWSDPSALDAIREVCGRVIDSLSVQSNGRFTPSPTTKTPPAVHRRVGFFIGDAPQQ